jgi:hypothetical protein
MSDLVKRLRGFPPNVHETMTEAADRIAALEAAVTQCRTLSAMLKPQAARIAALEAALRNLIDHTHDCEEDLIRKLYNADFWGESLPLTNARAALEGGKS